jgi:dihydroorotase
MRELDQAPYGMSMLETTLGCVVSCLIAPGHLNWPQAIAKLSTNPARILGLEKGTLQIGADADVTIIDPHERWTVDPDQFRSQSGNCPLRGQQLTGRARQVLVGGKIRLDRAPQTRGTLLTARQNSG